MRGENGWEELSGKNSARRSADFPDGGSHYCASKDGPAPVSGGFPRSG